MREQPTLITKTGGQDRNLAVRDAAGRHADHRSVIVSVHAV